MEIKLPELGEGVSSAKVVDILVAEGDEVKQGDDVMEVETDKAVAGVPAESAGKVTSIKVSKGDEVSVGDVMATLEESTGEDGEDKEESDENEKDEDSMGDETPESESEEKKTDEDEDEQEDKPSGGNQKNVEKEDSEYKDTTGLGPPAGPELRKLARELGIDLNLVSGTGKGGRIEMSDLRSHILHLKQKAFGEEEHPLTEDLSQYGPINSEELPRIRKTISERLIQRWKSTPLVTQFGDADLERVIQLKDKFSDEFGDRDARLTVSVFFIKLLADLLGEYPEFNAAIDLKAEKIIYRDYIHVGIAVATERGLMVPVIRDVANLNALEIARGLEALSNKARNGELAKDDMRGASVYLSNQGAIGGGYFTPLLSGSETCILGVGKAQPRVVEEDGGFKSRPFVPLSFSYDHRLIDGAQAATFMTKLVAGLEQFEKSVLENQDKN